MAYTLISFTALGFDLARLQYGDHVGKVLDVALAMTPDNMTELANHHPGASRIVRWQQVRAAASGMHDRRPIRIDGQAISVMASDGTAKAMTALEMLRSLETSPLGNLDALDRLIRREIMHWSWTHEGDVSVQDDTACRAADVLIDAAAAGYASGGLDAATRRDMIVPYLRSVAHWRRTMGYTPHIALPPNVAMILDQFCAQSLICRDRWRKISALNVRKSGAWSKAMNQACWAVHVTGREHAAAAAQLGALRAFRDTGFIAKDVTGGGWNALSGAVQANMVHDVLDAKDLDVLLAPWRETFGS